MVFAKIKYKNMQIFFAQKGVIFMKDCILIGMALGFIAGALVVSNNSTAQKMVEKGKKALNDQVKKLKD